MERVLINYNQLEELAAESNLIAKGLNEYREEMYALEAELSANSIAAYDNKGYIVGALEEAKKKARFADEKADHYKQFSTKLTNLHTTSKECDSLAATNVANVFDAYIGQRSWLQKVGDFIYGEYVNFLDKIAGTGPIGEFIANCLKKASDWIDNEANKVVNWFKYGGGKYILNTILAITDTLVAVGVFVAAFAAAVFTGPVWLAVVGVIGFAAASVFLVQQTVDSETRIIENAKAYHLQEEGNLTAARYYGEIDGLKSKSTHYDYGNKSDNDRVEKLADIWDDTKTIAKTTASVCTVISSAANLGLVEDANGKSVVDFKRAFEGSAWKKSYDAGFYSNDYNTGGFDAGKALNIPKKIFGSSNQKILGNNGIAKVLDGAKTISTINKMASSYEKLSNADLTAYEKVDKTFDIIGNIPIIDSFTGDIWKLISAPVKIAEAITN